MQPRRAYHNRRALPSFLAGMLGARAHRSTRSTASPAADGHLVQDLPAGRRRLVQVLGAGSPVQVLDLVDLPAPEQGQGSR